MTVSSSLPRLHSPFLCCPLKSISSCKSFPIQSKPTSYPCIRAIEFDQNTVSPPSFSLLFLWFLMLLDFVTSIISMFLPFQVVAVTVGLVSVAVGIGIPAFYESQIDNAVKCFTFTIVFLLPFLLVLIVPMCILNLWDIVLGSGKERKHPALLSLQWIWCSWVFHFCFPFIAWRDS